MAEGDECSSLVVPATKDAPSVHAGYLRGPEAGGLSSGDKSSSCEMLPTREESGGKEEREYERGEREMGERGRGMCHQRGRGVAFISILGGTR